MEADLCFPDGVTGRVVCSLFSRTLLRLRAEAVGETGRVRVFNPIAPQYYHRISVRGRRGRRRERVSGEATYTHQLRAFARAVGGGTPPLTPPEDAVANMRVIDALRRESVSIHAIRRRRPSLEDLFMSAVVDPETGRAHEPGAAKSPRGRKARA